MKSNFTKLFVLFIALMVSSIVVAKEDVPDSIPGTSKVTAEQLIELIDEHDDLVIIDARKASDRAKGYIEYSIGMPDTKTNPESLAKHLPSKSTPVIFYCNGVKCGRSGESAKIAISAGYKHVYWFRGGWEEWMHKGYPIAK